MLSPDITIVSVPQKNCHHLLSSVILTLDIRLTSIYLLSPERWVFLAEIWQPQTFVQILKLARCRNQNNRRKGRDYFWPSQQTRSVPKIRQNFHRNFEENYLGDDTEISTECTKRNFRDVDAIYKYATLAQFYNSVQRQHEGRFSGTGSTYHSDLQWIHYIFRCL